MLHNIFVQKKLTAFADPSKTVITDIEVWVSYSLEKILKDNVSHHLFKITYTLKGTLSQVLIPKMIGHQRKERLWQQTCFELFFLKEDGSYYEVNLSPSLEYNIYHFTSYRSEMAQSKAIEIISLSYQENKLEVIVDLKSLIFNKINICAVILNNNKSFSYHAFKHGLKENFHDHDHFISL